MSLSSSQQVETRLITIVRMNRNVIIYVGDENKSEVFFLFSLIFRKESQEFQNLKYLEKHQALADIYLMPTRMRIDTVMRSLMEVRSISMIFKKKNIVRLVKPRLSDQAPCAASHIAFVIPAHTKGRLASIIRRRGSARSARNGNRYSLSVPARTGRDKEECIRPFALLYIAMRRTRGVSLDTAGQPSGCAATDENNAICIDELPMLAGKRFSCAQLRGNYCLRPRPSPSTLLCVHCARTADQMIRVFAASIHLQGADVYKCINKSPRLALA